MQKRKLFHISGLLMGLSIIMAISLEGQQHPPEKQYPLRKIMFSSQGGTLIPIRLAGAKNDIVSLHFQVYMLKTMTLKVATAKESPDITWKYYQVVGVPRSSGRKDALLPLDQGLREMTKPVEIWLTGTINAAAPAGSREIDLIFSDGKVRFRQPLEIKIWDFSLPQDLPVTIMGSLYYDKHCYARQNADSQERYDALIKQYLAMMREFKFNALGRFYELPVEQLLMGKKIEDFPRFQQTLHYALNTLKFRYFFINYLTGVKSFGQPDSKFTPRAQIYYALFQGYLQKHSWENRGIIYLWDEPKQQQYDLVYRSYKAVKKIVPNIKTMMSSGERGESEVRLADVVDILVIYAKAINTSIVQAVKQKGQEVWLYANALHGIDQPMVNQRLIGWYMFHNQFSGYFFWGVNFFPQDPWSIVPGRQDPNRRGALFYPNPETGEPCSSLRLEAIRQGFQDFLYLQKFQEAHNNGQLVPEVYESIRKKIKAVTRDLNTLKPRVTMRELEDLRLEIGEALDCRQ